MLHSISWARFGAVVFLALAVYYGYVLIRFYGRDLLVLGRGGKIGNEEIPDGGTVSGKGMVAAGEKGLAVGGKGSVVGDKAQARLFERPAGETPELFKVMERVILLLRQVVTEGAGSGVKAEELQERIRGVLAGYRQLRKTPYEIAINNFISRTCATTFSLLISDVEIEALWG